MNFMHIQFKREDLYLIFTDFISKMSMELNLSQQMELNEITFDLVKEFMTFTNVENKMIIDSIQELNEIIWRKEFMTFTNVENEMIIDSIQELKHEIECILMELNVSKAHLFPLSKKEIYEKIDEAIKNKEDKKIMDFNISVFIDKKYFTLYNVLFSTIQIEHPEIEGSDFYIEYQDFEHPEYFDIIDAVIMNKKYKDNRIIFDHTGIDEQHLDLYYFIENEDENITFIEIADIK